MNSGRYWDCGICGVTVTDTNTTWLVPVWLEVKNIVPVYVPAVNPATLAEMSADEGVVPVRGIT